jgi:hypothetical protein
MRRLLHAGEHGLADGELLAGVRFELATQDDHVVLDRADALALEALEEVRGELRIVGELLPDLLEELLHLVDVGVEDDSEHQFLDHPIAREVLEPADLAVRNGRQRAAGVTERHETDGDLFNLRP